MSCAGNRTQTCCVRGKSAHHYTMKCCIEKFVVLCVYQRDCANFKFVDKLQITVVESIIKLRYEIREDLYNKNLKIWINTEDALPNFQN